MVEVLDKIVVAEQQSSEGRVAPVGRAKGSVEAVELRDGYSNLAQ
jgi:enolase